MNGKQNINAEGGFTLVEIVVAAIIIGLAIVAVATVARKSREIDITFRHHRRARAIIDSCLESDAYNYENYGSLANVSSHTVLIEDRSGGYTDLNGMLNITVTDRQFTDLNSVTGSYKEVNATVSWQEPEGSKSVTIVKGLANP